MSGKRDAITLYIPAFNASRTLREALAGVNRQTIRPDEIIVIDDGSSDDTVAIAESMGAKVIRHGVNKGIGAARNTATRNASHPLIAHLDSDAVPEPDWLEKLLEALDDDIVGVGGKLIEKNRAELADRWRSVHMAQHWGDSIVDNPAFLYGAGGIYRKSALEKIGGFDEECRTNFEDNDMGLRLRAAGMLIRYTPHAVAYHLRKDDLSSLLMTSWRWTRRPRDVTSFEFKIRKLIVHLWTFGIKLKRDVREMSPSLFFVSMLVTANNIFMDARRFLTGKEDRWW